MDEIKTDLTQIKKDLNDLKLSLKEELVEIKIDLKHHIYRTDLLEKEVKPVGKFISFLTWSGFVSGFLAAVFKIKQLLDK